jgi:hypothetical protein
VEPAAAIVISPPQLPETSHCLAPSYVAGLTECAKFRPVIWRMRE